MIAGELRALRVRMALLLSLLILSVTVERSQARFESYALCELDIRPGGDRTLASRVSGLVLMPELERMPMDELRAFDWNQAKLRPLGPPTPEPPPGEEADDGQLLDEAAEQASAVAGMVCTLFALVRAPSRLHQPDALSKFYRQVQAELKLQDDILVGDLLLTDVKPLDAQIVQEIRRVVEAHAKKLNELVGQVLWEFWWDAAKPGTLKEWLLLLSKKGLDFKNFRDVLLHRTLLVYVWLVQGLLWALKGFRPPARNLLQNAGLDALASGPSFQLHVPADEGYRYLHQPLEVGVKLMEQACAGKALFEQETQQAGLIFEKDEVYIDWSAVEALQTKVDMTIRKMGPLDLKAQAAFWLITYATLVKAKLTYAKFRLLHGKKLSVNYVELAFQLRCGGYRVEAYQRAREVLTGLCSELKEDLVKLEQEISQGWDISSGFDAKTNLLFGGIKSSPQQVVRPRNSTARMPDWRQMLAGAVHFDYGSYSERRAALLSLGPASLRGLSTAEVRLWVVFAVIRALIILRGQALGLVELGQISADRLDMLDLDTYKTIFAQGRIPVKLDLVEKIAGNGSLEPEHVAAVLDKVLLPNKMSRLLGSPRWSLRMVATSELAEPVRRTITFRPHRFNVKKAMQAGPERFPAHQLVRWIMYTFRTHLCPDCASHWWDRLLQRPPSKKVRKDLFEKAFPLFLFGQLPLKLEAALNEAEACADGVCRLEEDENLVSQFAKFKELVGAAASTVKPCTTTEEEVKKAKSQKGKKSKSP